MAFASGVFSRLYDFVTDKANGIKVRADRFDDELDGIATGLSTCLLKDGTQTPTANIPLGGFKLTGVGDPTSAQDAATKNYVDTAASFTNTDVRAATTANITIATALNNGDTLDGLTLADGEFVLVKNQTTASENGIYTVAASPARATGFDTWDEHVGAILNVQEGTANAGLSFRNTNNTGGTLDTDDITFEAFGGAVSRASLGLATTDSPQFEGINVGHATDTTITRTGAGDVAVEGAALYRAGGTDVPVADGGTGRSTATALGYNFPNSYFPKIGVTMAVRLTLTCTADQHVLAHLGDETQPLVPPVPLAGLARMATARPQPSRLLAFQGGKMITLEEFKGSLSQENPPAGLNGLLQALWQDSKGDWNTAHQIVQDISSPNAAWVHAYLHRKEGDPTNATYWYRRANKPVSQASLDEEWAQIATALLQLE